MQCSDMCSIVGIGVAHTKMTRLLRACNKHVNNLVTTLLQPCPQACNNYGIETVTTQNKVVNKHVTRLYTMSLQGCYKVAISMPSDCQQVCNKVVTRL